MSGDPRIERREHRRSLLLQGAIRRWERNERIDLDSLAAEHGVSRTSAYRWFGDNDQLLAEVMVVRTREMFDRQREKHRRKRGRVRVLAITADFMRGSAESMHFQPLLRRDPQRILRIVASSAYPPQRLTVSLFEGLLIEESATGNLVLPIDAHTLAYGITRLIEAFLYADLVAGEEVDLESAMVVIGLLLPE